MIKMIVFSVINCILIVAGYFWFRENIQYDLLLNNLKLVSQDSIFICYIPYVFLLLFYGIRTAIVLNINFKVAFPMSMIGHGLNNICPFRLGEVIKTILSKRFYGISVYAQGFSFVIEKAFDLICLSLLGFIFVLFSKKLNHLGWFLGIFVFSMSIIYLLKSNLKSKLKSNIYKGWKISNCFDKLNEAINFCKIDEKMASISFLTIMIWIMTILNFHFYFSMNLESYHFTILDSIFILLITIFSLTVPLTVGNFGLFEGAIIYYLESTFSILPEHALALALIFHLTMVIPQILSMLIFIFYNESKSFYSYLFAKNYPSLEPAGSGGHHSAL